MSNQFPELFIWCDTREQSAYIKNHNEPSAIVKGKDLISDYTDSELAYLAKKRPRIAHIYDYFSHKGSEVGIKKLDRCDYHVSGFHRDHEIDIGVEYKALTDLMGSHEDLPWKLWESVDIFRDVALFVEGKVDIEESNGYNWVRNWAADTDTLRYDLYQSRLATWQDQGVQVRQFDKLMQFGPSLDGVIDYVSKEGHRSFEYREPCGNSLILKILTQIPGIKIYTVNKLLSGNSDLSFAELMQWEMKDLQKKVGKKTGETIWKMFHDPAYKPEKRKRKEE